MEIPEVEAPWVTAEQMAEVDRAMVEDYGIGLIQMMELAGRHLADLARVRFLGGEAPGRSVLVLAGPGGNGGGALVAARRLASWGARVTVALARDRNGCRDVPAHQLAIVQRLGIPVLGPGEPPTGTWDLVLDGLVGYSLRGAPRGWTGHLIELANGLEAPVLSLDLPSGVEASSGRVLEPAVRAAATLTLALPKTGLRAPGAAACTGELYLADIGVPPRLYARPPLDLEVPPIFAGGEVVRLASGPVTGS